MAIDGTETLELQICDSCTINYVENKTCILIIQNILDATTIDDQDESSIHPGQDKNQGSTVNNEDHARCGNQIVHDSEKNPLNHYGKEMRTHTNKVLIMKGKH